MINTLGRQEDIPTIGTGTGPGPTQLSGVEKTNGRWEEIEKQAPNDPKAAALLELKQLINDEILVLKGEGKSFKQDLGDYQKSLKRVDNLLIGIVVVVSVAFITTLSLVFFDLIKDKDLYLQNNNLYRDYSDKNIKFSDIINDQKVEISNLKNEIQRIYDKNSYLK